MSQNVALEFFLMSQNVALKNNSNVAECSIKPLKCIKCFIIYVKYIKI